MSLKAMVWALQDADTKGDAFAKLVLIGLADHANNDGRDAFPSCAQLARYAGCSERSVHNKLRLLESEGLIRRGDQSMVAHRPANRRPTVYDVALGVNSFHPKGTTRHEPAFTPENPSPLNQGSPQNGPWGEHDDISGVNRCADIDSPLTVLLTDTSEASVDEQFSRWYRTYPRRVGRGAALRAFKAALKKPGVTLDVLNDTATKYARSVQGRDPQYIPHPATWLNGERWADEAVSTPSSPWDPEFHKRPVPAWQDD